MNFEGAILTGLCSRSQETIKEHRLLRDGHSTEEKFLEKIKKDEKEIIDAQNNFAFVSGGQLSWLDLLRPISSFQGFKQKADDEGNIGPVTRWFRTNTFYRKPKVTGKISCDGHELSNTLPSLKKNGILFLPGPYTFTKLIENRYYIDAKELTRDYANSIALSIAELKRKGYTALLFLEPAVGYDLSRKQEVNIQWVNEFASIVNSNGITTGITFPLCDGSRILPALERTDFDFIGIDAFSTLITEIETSKDLIFGVIDGAEIDVETETQIIDLIQSVIEKTKFSGNYYIGPNNRLFDIPFEQGLQKIKILSATAAKIRDGKHE